MNKIKNKQFLETEFANNFASPYFPVLAELYLKEGDLRRAKLVCETGLEHDSENDCGKFILAQIALSENKLVIAEKYLKEAISINPSNFNAIRMLLKVEQSLNRSINTINKYANQILQYIPDDLECNDLLSKNEKNTAKSKEPIATKSKNIKPKITKKINKIKTPQINKQTYDIKSTMATFTMVGILKKQEHYQQALDVLNLLESKKSNLDRIKKEKKIISSLLLKEKSN